jgi:hypothetical protein
LDPTRHQIIYISNPVFGTRGLYVSIVRALGDQPRYQRAELIVQAADLLAAEVAERHRRVIRLGNNFAVSSSSGLLYRLGWRTAGPTGAGIVSAALGRAEAHINPRS